MPTIVPHRKNFGFLPIFRREVVGSRLIECSQLARFACSPSRCVVKMYVQGRIQRFLTVATIFSAKRAFWHGWRTILFALSVDARWIESLQILWIHHSIHNSCRMESMCTLTTTPIEKSCISYSLITARYTFKLEPLPDYSGEVQPSDASKCVILREWVKREIEVRW